MKCSVTIFMLLAAMLLGTTATAQTPYSLTIPKVAPGSITIDGTLTEGSWADTSGTLNFGVGGRTGGFDNELDYTIWGDTQYAYNPQIQIKMRHDGQGHLYVAYKSIDADIQGGDGTNTNWWDYQDADGLGSFVVKKKDLSTYDGTTLTFFPPATNQQETGIQPGLAGTYHFGTTRGTTWDWSFLPGNNTVNKIDDQDAGYVIEFVIDLTTSGYAAADTDIQVGIMVANHNGPRTDPYPWSVSVFNRFQWSVGSYDVNYGIDHLILSEEMAVGPTPPPPHDLAVPKVTPGSITLDGVLNESIWASTSGTLTFGLGGKTAGFDNALDYTIWGNVQYAHDPRMTIKMRHDGQGKLYVAYKSIDPDIQGGNGTSTAWWDYQDSDGMGSFVVKKKDIASYNGTTLTFFPPATNPEETEIQTALGGTIHNGQARGTTWNWAFLPGNNTVNKIDDLDTGYVIEFVIDLTQSGYAITDNDITMGIMSANHDGPLGDPYPWSNSCFTRFQWTEGSYDVNYGVNHIYLSPEDTPPAPAPSAAHDWMLY